MRVMRAVDIAGRIKSFCEFHFDGENRTNAISALNDIAKTCKENERSLNFTLNAICKHLLDNHVEMGIVKLRRGFEDWQSNILYAFLGIDFRNKYTLTEYGFSGLGQDIDTDEYLEGIYIEIGQNTRLEIFGFEPDSETRDIPCPLCKRFEWRTIRGRSIVVWEGNFKARGFKEYKKHVRSIMSSISTEFANIVTCV